MRQYHLIPDEDEDSDHTTSSCQCGPVQVTLDNDQGFKEQVVFHFTDEDYDFLDDRHFEDDEERADDEY